MANPVLSDPRGLLQSCSHYKNLNVLYSNFEDVSDTTELTAGNARSEAKGATVSKALGVVDLKPGHTYNYKLYRSRLRPITDKARHADAAKNVYSTNERMKHPGSGTRSNANKAFKEKKSISCETGQVLTGKGSPIKTRRSSTSLKESNNKVVKKRSKEEKLRAAAKYDSKAKKNTTNSFILLDRGENTVVSSPNGVNKVNKITTSNISTRKKAFEVYDQNSNPSKVQINEVKSGKGTRTDKKSPNRVRSRESQASGASGSASGRNKKTGKSGSEDGSNKNKKSKAGDDHQNIKKPSEKSEKHGKSKSENEKADSNATRQQKEKNTKNSASSTKKEMERKYIAQLRERLFVVAKEVKKNHRISQRPHTVDDVHSKTEEKALEGTSVSQPNISQQTRSDLSSRQTEDLKKLVKVMLKKKFEEMRSQKKIAAHPSAQDTVESSSQQKLIKESGETNDKDIKEDKSKTKFKTSEMANKIATMVRKQLEESFHASGEDTALPDTSSDKAADVCVKGEHPEVRKKEKTNPKLFSMAQSSRGNTAQWIIEQKFDEFKDTEET